MIWAVRLRMGPVAEAKLAALEGRLQNALAGANGEAHPPSARPLAHRPPDAALGLPERMAAVMNIPAGQAGLLERRVESVVELERLLDQLEAAVGDDAEWLELDTHLCAHDEPVSDEPGAGVPPPCEPWQPARRRGNRG